jgi:hypothetical protein
MTDYVDEYKSELEDIVVDDSIDVCDGIAIFKIILTKNNANYEEEIDLNNGDIDEIAASLAEEYNLEQNLIKKLIEKKLKEIYNPTRGQEERLTTANDVDSLCENNIVNKNYQKKTSNISQSITNSTLSRNKGYMGSTSTSKNYGSSKCPSIAYDNKKCYVLSNFNY